MAENEEKNVNIEENTASEVAVSEPQVLDDPVAENSAVENPDAVGDVITAPSDNDVIPPGDEIEIILPTDDLIIDDGPIIDDTGAQVEMPENIQSQQFEEDAAVVNDEEGEGYPEEMPDEYEEISEQGQSRKGKKVKVIRRLNIEKNQRAIARQRRNKMIGKVLACVFVLIFVGTIAGITAGAYTVADRLWWENVGEEADVQFKELFTLFNGVVDANEEKIVTKGYSDNDLDDFYSNLKNKMFLAQDYDLSISKIISSVMSATGEEQESAGSTSYTTIGVDGYDLQYVYYDLDGNMVTSDEKPSDEEIGDSDDNKGEDNSSLTGNEQLDELLKELKFDFSSLAQYEGEKNILEIPDRQLAAVVNDAFSALAGSFGQLEDIEKSIGKPINEVLAVKQIIISGNEIDIDTSLKITLEVKAKELLSNLLKEFGIPSIVKLILPDKLYASVRVYPYDTTKPVEASINRLEETKVNKIVRIIDVILKKTGETTSISDLLVQVNGKVVEVLDGAQKKLPIAFVPSGSVDLYPIASLMGMLNVDVSEQAFLYMLKDIKLPTGESLKLVMPTLDEIKQKTSAFVSEISVKYCLDNSDGKISDDNTIKDVMNFASSDDALEAIHLNDMDYSGNYSQRLKVRTEYDALAGMLSDYVRNEGLLGDISADIVKMSCKSEMLSVDLRVNLSQMLGFDDDSVMSSLIKQLVPEYIYVSANICVNADKNIPTTIEINKTGEDHSKQHLQTLTALANKFGMDTSSLTYDGICEKVDGGLKEGLAQMQEKIGCDIDFTDECAYLPDLFEVVCGTGMLDEDEEHKIEPEKLYNIMKQVNTFEVASADCNKTNSASGFIDELESKYYVQQGMIVDDENLLHSVMGLKKTFGSSINQSALAQDDRGMNEIYPMMTAGEFAHLMELNIDMENMSEALKSAQVLGARINDDEIVLYLQAYLYETKQDDVRTHEESADVPQDGEGETPIEEEEIDLSKYSNLLPQLAYVTLIIDAPKMIANGEENCVKVVIDGMEDEDMADFFSIIRKLSGKNMTESEIESNIDVEVKEFMKDVKGIDYKFADDALTLDHLFSVMASSDLMKSEDPADHVFTPQELRRLLKELYGYDYDAASGGNFAPSDNLDNFIDVELYNKYFISDSFKESLKTDAKNDSLLDGFKEIGGKSFSIENIRTSDLTSLKNITDTTDKSQSQINQEINANFKPKFSREEIAHLMRTHVSAAGDMSFLKDQEVVFADNDENVMTLTLRAKDNLEDENAKGLMPEYLYISVTIELGSISKESGERSPMNVYAMDINSVSYVEDKGNDQDLQLLLKLIDRLQNNTKDEGAQPPEEVSLDKIMQDIEESLEEFRGQIHNDTFTVTFLAQGGLMFNETVYQISLNSIYGASAKDYETQSEMPEEIHFRNGLCKVNNMPQKYEYAQGVFLDFANGNRADDSSKAIADINDKYALAHPLQDGATAILTILGDYAKDYAKSIDGQKLTSQQKRLMSVEQLRPSIDGEELLLMIENSVEFSADGYQDTVMRALYILDDKMIIVYNSLVDIEQENDKFADLLPQEMSIIVDIDVDALVDTDALCTKIRINDLSDSEAKAIQSMVGKLNEKEGKESKSIDEANVECSDSVRDTMRSLTDNMQVRYVADDTVDGVTGGGVMVLDSIYEVSAKKISQADNQGNVQPQEVKDTLEALYNRLNLQGFDLPNDLSDDNAVSYTIYESLESDSNLLLLADVATRKMQISGAIGDWNIASKLDTDKLLESLQLAKSAATLQHVVFAPKSSNDVDGEFNTIRQKLGLLDNNEYFLITLDMNMTDAAGTEMSILPECADLTIIYELASEEVSIKYNSMTEGECDILTRLMKTNNSQGGGLDLNNTDDAKSEIFNMTIIEVTEFSYTLTLGQLLQKCNEIAPTKSVTNKKENVVLGKGAMIVDYEAQY